MPALKALGVHVVTVCRAADVVVMMSVYVLAYVVVSVTTDSCTVAAGDAEQPEGVAVEKGASVEDSVEDDAVDEEEVEVELVMVDSKTVMTLVVIVSVEYSTPVLVTVAVQGFVLYAKATCTPETQVDVVLVKAVVGEACAM